jgi:hypothetical protein
MRQKTLYGASCMVMLRSALHELFLSHHRMVDWETGRVGNCYVTIMKKVYCDCGKVFWEDKED